MRWKILSNQVSIWYFPVMKFEKTAWDVLKNFDHALILREDDPLLPAVLDVYEKQGIRNGAPQNQMKGAAFKTELATAYPDCRLVGYKKENYDCRGHD